MGLELVVDSEHDPHFRLPLLHPTDGKADQDLAVRLPKERRHNSSEGSICLL